MILFDTHTHLYLSEFDSDRDSTIQKAIDCDIQTMILPNVDSETILPMLNLCLKFPQNCFPLIGLHPTSVKQGFERELQIVEQELKQGKYYGIGEIGLDLYWDKNWLEQQKNAFETQLIWAKEMGFPVVIHTRNAFDEIFEILDKINDDRLEGIFHCYSGNIQQAQKIIDYGGFKFGIGGVVTYKNGGLDKVVDFLSLSDIVLETDSPYLAPAPHRGKRNESSYLNIIAQKVADIKNVSIEKIAEITTSNAREIFNL